MKTILLCGYRTSDEFEPALGLARDADGRTLIDRRILQLQAIGHQVICVLAGNVADDILRSCRQIDSCELLFDDEPTGCTLLSNLRTGAAALNGEAGLILPVEVPPPEKNVWDFLRNELAKVGWGTSTCFLQAVDAKGAPCHYGFPLLLTRNGAKVLQNTTDLTSLVDPRLTYLHLDFSIEAELEHESKPL